MKVVNLFAGPSTGKSTTSAILYGMLSMAGYAAEYVPEFARFATYGKLVSALSDQLYMVAKQHNRLHVLKSANLDFVIMDGPLPLALLYTPRRYFQHYEPLVLEVFNAYDNVNFFLQRNPTHSYQTHGRVQSEDEARGLCRRIRRLLVRCGVPFDVEPVDNGVAGRIFTRLTGLPPPVG